MILRILWIDFGIRIEPDLNSKFLGVLENYRSVSWCSYRVNNFSFSFDFAVFKWSCYIFCIKEFSIDFSSLSDSMVIYKSFLGNYFFLSNITISFFCFSYFLFVEFLLDFWPINGYYIYVSQTLLDFELIWFLGFLFD